MNVFKKVIIAGALMMGLATANAATAVSKTLTWTSPNGVTRHIEFVRVEEGTYTLVSDPLSTELKNYFAGIQVSPDVKQALTNKAPGQIKIVNFKDAKANTHYNLALVKSISTAASEDGTGQVATGLYLVSVDSHMPALYRISFKLPENTSALTVDDMRAVSVVSNPVLVRMID